MGIVAEPQGISVFPRPSVVFVYVFPLSLLSLYRCHRLSISLLIFSFVINIVVDINVVVDIDINVVADIDISIVADADADVVRIDILFRYQYRSY